MAWNGAGRRSPDGARPSRSDRPNRDIGRFPNAVGEGKIKGLDHEARRIWMDGRKHPEDNPNPTAMGYSIGHWDGATLVVDTRGFKESPAFRVPHSDQYHMVERIRRIRDGGLLEIDVSIEDPVAYTQPLKGSFYFNKDPKIEITEYNCDGMFDYRPYTPKK